VLCAGVIASLVVFSGRLFKRILLAVTCIMAVWNCFHVLPCCSGLQPDRKIRTGALVVLLVCVCVCVSVSGFFLIL